MRRDGGDRRLHCASPGRAGGVLILACALLLGGCQSSAVRTLNHADDTRQLSEYESRRWYAAEELDRHWRNKGLIYSDGALGDYLQGIAVALYPEFGGTLKLRVLDSPDLNAFALPNGSVYLNLGLIARMENEAQLATIVAHEVSHFKFQHSLKQRHATEGAVVAGWAVTLLTGIPLSGQLLALGAMSGYSQDAEREADREGFARMVAHGYDPGSAAAVFDIMRAEAEALDSDEPWLYASHPKLTERMQTMQSLAVQQPSAGGRRESARFLRETGDLRSVLLDRYLIGQKYKQLIHVLENAEIRPRYPGHADFYLGEAYRQRAEEGDGARALAAYHKAVGLAPDFAPSYRALALIRMQNDERPEARRLFKRYLELAPEAIDRKYIEMYLQRIEGES
ncbi:MAG: M48 family metalloprotease [Gammaproteobacteria bacterium]|nr:M48 family metalloprotease [Gammaproteobacteria bacterium]